MNIFAFIFALVAMVLFLIGNRRAWYERYTWYHHVSLGLFFLTLAWVVEILTASRQVHL